VVLLPHDREKVAGRDWLTAAPYEGVNKEPRSVRILAQQGACLIVNRQLAMICVGSSDGLEHDGVIS
jgi:hypothetical protein